MKNRLLPILTIALVIFATSCSKEKVCSCDQEITGQGVVSTTETVIEDGECSDLDSETSLLGITTTLTCVEK